MKKLAPYFWSTALVAYFAGALVFMGYLVGEAGSVALSHLPDSAPSPVVLLVEASQGTVR